MGWADLPGPDGNGLGEMEPDSSWRAPGRLRRSRGPNGCMTNWRQAGERADEPIPVRRVRLPLNASGPMGRRRGTGAIPDFDPIQQRGRAPRVHHHGAVAADDGRPPPRARRPQGRRARAWDPSSSTGRRPAARRWPPRHGMSGSEATSGQPADRRDSLSAIQAVTSGSLPHVANRATSAERVPQHRLVVFDTGTPIVPSQHHRDREVLVRGADSHRRARPNSWNPGHHHLLDPEVSQHGEHLGCGAPARFPGSARRARSPALDADHRDDVGPGSLGSPGRRRRGGPGQRRALFVERPPATGEYVRCTTVTPCARAAGGQVSRWLPAPAWQRRQLGSTDRSPTTPRTSTLHHHQGGTCRVRHAGARSRGRRGATPRALRYHPKWAACVRGPTVRKPGGQGPPRAGAISLAGPTRLLRSARPPRPRSTR